MEIRIYVEGGGDSANQKADIRRGLGEFLQELRDQARSRRIRWNIIACGTRQNAYEDFNVAQRTHPEAFNVLLVDSEGPVSSRPFEHLASRDQWNTTELLNDRYHLMVQVMEAWFIADLENLGRFYGNQFNRNPIPRRPNVEEIDKDLVANSLETATRHTQKGRYHKIRHGAKLLGLINSTIVRESAPHCGRLFAILGEKIQNNKN